MENLDRREFLWKAPWVAGAVALVGCGTARAQEEAGDDEPEGGQEVQFGGVYYIDEVDTEDPAQKVSRIVVTIAYASTTSTKTVNTVECPRTQAFRAAIVKFPGDDNVTSVSVQVYRGTVAGETVECTGSAPEGYLDYAFAVTRGQDNTIITGSRRRD